MKIIFGTKVFLILWNKTIIQVNGLFVSYMDTFLTKKYTN